MDKVELYWEEIKLNLLKKQSPEAINSFKLIFFMGISSATRLIEETPEEQLSDAFNGVIDKLDEMGVAMGLKKKEKKEKTD